jgi:hypothetical protein
MRSPIKLAPAGLALALLLSPLTAHAIAGPFAALTGNWSGAGKIVFSDGHEEGLRCRATESGGQGDNLQLTLRCASASYNFELSSDVTYQGGAISGSWSEASHNVGGSLTGRASGNHIEAAARAPNFAANLSLTTTGNRQMVSIRSAGSEIAEVTLALSRR